MKRKQLCLLLAVAFGTLLLSSYAGGPFFFGAGNRTGSAGSGVGCSANSSCHSSVNLSTSLYIQLLDSLGNSVLTYNPGSTYRVLLRELAPGTTRTHFGFQASIVKAADGSTQAGSLATGGTPNIAVYNAPPQLVEHSQPLQGIPTSGNYLDTVSFQWTAPTAGMGRVRIYAVLNAVNFDGTSSGDGWVDTTAEFDPAPLATPAYVQAAWSLTPNPVQDELRLRGAAPHARLWICDALGRVVYQAGTDAAGQARCALGKLPSGTYFLRVSGPESGRAVAFQKE